MVSPRAVPRKYRTNGSASSRVPTLRFPGRRNLLKCYSPAHWRCHRVRCATRRVNEWGPSTRCGGGKPTESGRSSSIMAVPPAIATRSKRSLPPVAVFVAPAHVLALLLLTDVLPIAVLTVTLLFQPMAIGPLLVVVPVVIIAAIAVIDPKLN